MTHPNEPQAGLTQALHHARDLLTAELRLAKSDAANSLRKASTALLCLALAVVTALVGLTALAAAAVLGLADLGLPLSLAALLVAAIFLVATVGLGLICKARLSAKALRPSRTLTQFKRDKAALKEMTHA